MFSNFCFIKHYNKTIRAPIGILVGGGGGGGLGAFASPKIETWLFNFVFVLVSKKEPYFLCTAPLVESEDFFLMFCFVTSSIPGLYMYFFLNPPRGFLKLW